MDETLRTLLEAYQEHPIAYMPIYSRITGRVTAGILLSQIVYWDGRMQHRQFYKTDKDFCEELSMGAAELKNAKKTLIRMGLVIVMRKGIPAKTHYKLNRGKLSDLITTSVKKSKPVKGKPTNKNDDIELTNTESTQEITSDKNIYAFLNQKSNSSKDTVENHVKNHPSNNEYIDKTILRYLDYYSESMQKPHPKITIEQYQRVVDTLTQEGSNYEFDFENYECIIESWFADLNVRSNYNILHFASEGVIRTHYYKGLY